MLCHDLLSTDWGKDPIPILYQVFTQICISSLPYGLCLAYKIILHIKIIEYSSPGLGQIWMDYVKFIMYNKYIRLIL